MASLNSSTMYQKESHTLHVPYHIITLIVGCLCLCALTNHIIMLVSRYTVPKRAMNGRKRKEKPDYHLDYYLMFVVYHHITTKLFSIHQLLGVKWICSRAERSVDREPEKIITKNLPCRSTTNNRPKLQKRERGIGWRL
jgi:hypothetical protein